MVILFTTPITKSAMFGTDIAIYLTRDTVDSLLRKRLLLIIKDCPRIEEE